LGKIEESIELFLFGLREKSVKMWSSSSRGWKMGTRPTAKEKRSCVLSSNGVQGMKSGYADDNVLFVCVIRSIVELHSSTSGFRSPDKRAGVRRDHHPEISGVDINELIEVDRS
jgi:hypothetical protein